METRFAGLAVIYSNQSNKKQKYGAIFEPTFVHIDFISKGLRPWEVIILR